jgi:hypothetical protein
VFVGQTAYFEVGAGTSISSSLTVTPAAPAWTNLVFTPASVTLLPGQSTAAVRVTIPVTTPVEIFNNAVVVTWTLSGPDTNTTFLSSPRNTFTVSKLTVTTTQAPAVEYGVWSEDWVVYLSSPAPADLTITPVGQNEIVFNPPTWVFAAGESRKALKYMVSPINGLASSATVQVALKLSGTAANWVTIPSDQSFLVSSTGFSCMYFFIDFFPRDFPPPNLGQTLA